MRKWLIELRKNRNLTQESVAQRAGVTRQMISAIENGEASPGIKTAKAIGAILNFDWTYFYREKETVGQKLNN